MSLGVLNNIAAIYAQNNLNQTQSSLQNVLTQLSSGSRINSGADDAAGLAVANGLNANVAALTQSSQNATQGVGLLQTADGALAQVTNLLNRAVTLATEAANGTLNSNQVSSANQEYQNIISEVGNIGSTTNYNGNTVFSATATKLFVSDGTSSGANVFSDTVGALTTTSVGQSAPGAVVTSAVTNPTASASGAAVQSTSTMTFGASTDTTTGTLSLGIGTGAQHSITIAAATSLTNIAAQINGDSTFSAEGISASLSGAVLTLKGPASGAGTLTIGPGTVTDSTTSATITPTAPTTGSTGASTGTITLGATTDTLGGSLNIAVGAGSAHAITVAAGTSGAGLAAQINADAAYATAGVTAAYNSTSGALTISGPTGAGNTLSFSGSSLTQSTTTAPGAGVDFTATAISSLTSASAQTVLTSVTSAIADVAYQRGTLGANINQLNAASNVASAESENLTSASNNIQATNYGQATSELAKFQVLSQTGISALAQANSVQQEILKLLQ